MTIHGAIIELVEKFLHLGTKRIRMKVIFMKLQELNLQVKLTSHCYQYLNVNNVHRLTKTELCRAALRYGSKGWNTNTIYEMPIDSYERNVLGEIWGAVKENGK